MAELADEVEQTSPCRIRGTVERAGNASALREPRAELLGGGWPLP